MDKTDTRKPLTDTSFLDALKRKIIVYDGATGTNLQKMNLTAEQFGGERTNGCNDFLVLTYPEAVESLHRAFLDAGADVIETDTFRANRMTLAEFGLQDRVVEINHAAASLAKRIAEEYTEKTGQQRFVAGAMGPSGKLISINEKELSNISFDEIKSIYREQSQALIEGGVDILLIETSQDILEVKAIILAIQEAFEATGKVLPVQAQVSLDTTGRMLLGTDMAAALAILEGMAIDVIGMNCSTGPEHMREAIKYLSEHSTLPISCIPNAGLPQNINGEAVYLMGPEPFADDLVSFVTNQHINVIGGCCGTEPEHIRVLVERTKGLIPVERQPVTAALLASGTRAQPIVQVPAPFLIGERLNTQGSRKFKELALAEDYDSMLAIAENQIESGAHGLDICVALTEKANEAEMMHQVLKTLSPLVQVPFIIDSTEADVLVAALQSAPGKCLINSTNFESGRAKADKVFSIARAYNAAVMILTIDETGMAKTAEQKLKVAQRAYDMAVNEYGFKPDDLVFDPLTFTLATGDPEYLDSAVQTFEGIRQIKAALPGVSTSLGISNISFGLTPAARAVINSVALYHAVQAGLDMAIVNPAHIKPYAELSTEEVTLAEDLIFNRRPDSLQAVITYFESHGQSGVKENAAAQALGSMPAEERLGYRIVHRVKDGVEADIQTLIDQRGDLSAHEKAVQVLNGILLPAMKVVGDKFGSGELILPFVLQSAEVMKKAVSYLEGFLEKQEGLSKGKIVLATVYGDVHDIGKNLVKTILSNNGFDVVDLGKQVPAETIINRAVEEKADAIGLSALLVSTSKQMPVVVNELERRGLSIPVLIGGAAINKKFGRRILQTESGSFYEPGVYYCKDAFEGLDTIEQFRDEEKFSSLKLRILEESRSELARASQEAAKAVPRAEPKPVEPARDIPQPKKWGVFKLLDLPLLEVAECISRNELFRLSWGAKNTHGDAWKLLEAEYTQRLDEMVREAAETGWLKPQAVYGFWPAQADDADLIIYDPELYEQQGKLREIERFTFPRQLKGDRLCLADYFSPAASGLVDVVGFQVVTVGQKATERFDAFQEAGEYTAAYFSHGFAVQMAEATAEYVHKYLRRELNIPENRGLRYSWGYPAIPELSDHAKVFRLLPAAETLGMSLTSAYQLVPEQSTAAIVIHHPAAIYYNVGEKRIDQLFRE